MRKKKFIISKEEIYEAFPPHTPSRPIFEPSERKNFGGYRWEGEGEAVRAEELLSVPRELIDWNEYYSCSPDAYLSIPLFSENFFKDVFPSLLCFTDSNEAWEPNGLHNLASSFVMFHLDINEISKDWEMDFILSMNETQSQIIAKVVINAPYGDGFENHWFKFFP